MGKKAIVIDNNASVQQVIKDVFSKREVDVITADDGLSGLDLTLEEQPDMLFVANDINGVAVQEFCERMKKHNHRNVPIFLISDENVPDFDTLQTAGVVDTVTKPINEESMMHTVEQYITLVQQDAPEPAEDETAAHDEDTEVTEKESDVDIGTLLGWQQPEESAEEETDKPEISETQEETVNDPGQFEQEQEASPDDSTVYVLDEDEDTGETLAEYVTEEAEDSQDEPSPALAISEDEQESESSYAQTATEYTEENISTSEDYPCENEQEEGEGPRLYAIDEISSGTEEETEMSADEKIHSCEICKCDDESYDGECVDKMADQTVETFEDSTPSETAMPEPESSQQPKEAISDLTEEQVKHIITETVGKTAKDVIEQVVWDVVPDMAEMLVKQEIKKLLKEGEAPF